MWFNVLLIVVALASAAGTFLAELRSEAEETALAEQEKHLKTFWRILSLEGGDFRIVNGQLLSGEYLLNDNHELPDTMSELFGCTATIFMGDTRVSTNIITKDGRRAIGTKLQGPAYDAIFKQGKPYRGEVLILGVPYFSAYDPIKDPDGKIIGAVYVGVKKSLYFETYNYFRNKIIVTTIALIVIFSFLAFLLLRFQRRAESEIQESNELFRTAFDSIPDYISISTIDNGTWIDVNPGFTNMMGYTREEVVGKIPFALGFWHDPDDRCKLVEVLEGNGRVNNLESRFVNKNGAVVNVSISGRIIKLRGKPYLFSFVRDITEQKKTEDALKRVNHVLRILTRCNEILVRAEDEKVLLRDICHTVIDDGTYCFAWVGYAENNPEKTIRPVAQAGMEMGLTENLGLTWADKEKGRGPSATAIRTGRPCLIKDVLKDNAFAPRQEQTKQLGYRSILSVPLKYTNSVLGSLSVYASMPDAFDAEEINLITQLANDLAYGIISIHTREKHRQTAEALFESAKEYQKLARAHDQKQQLLVALLDSIPDLIFYKDPKGIYLGCNKAFESFAGMPAESLTGLSDFDIFPRNVAESFRDMDREIMSHRMACRNEEWVNYPDGRRVLLDTLKTPFYDQTGNMLGLIGISRDVTHQKHSDEERKKLESQLHQAQRMEAIGQLAGGIAHDFNNLLTVITGYSEIIKVKLEQESHLQRYIDQVLTAGERAAELTNGLLAFSRKQVMLIKPLDLCELVRGLKKMLRRLMPEDIDFSAQFVDNPLIVMADRGQLEQVLMNLVTNAKDAMPKGGKLLIDLSPVEMQNSFEHAHGRGKSGRYACLSITDTGVGMDAETREKIFEPFFTTKEVGKGTGLGMAIIYGIVSQHNGYISVESEPGTGTTFRIYLPLMVKDERSVNELTQEEQPAGGTETVLLAEDDATVRELHSMMLEEAGYTVIGAVDGSDALNKFSAHQETVDILVTDVIMPKFDGKKVITEIRKIRPQMKVLFMSGYTKDLFVQRGILDQEFNFLSKPVSATGLLKAVRDILDQN